MQCRYCDEMYHDRWSLMQHQKTHRSGRYRIDVSIDRTRKRLRGFDVGGNIFLLGKRYGNFY